MQAIGLGLVVLIGATAQRVTGLGFSLVVSPYMVLLLGPFQGVLLVNACGAVAAAILLTQVWRDVEVRRAALLLGSGLPAILLGVWVARELPAPVLAVFVGGLVLVALLAVVATERARVLRGTPGAVIAGAGSGFLNATVGAGGPAIAVYAVSVGWEQRGFAATAQLIFGTQGAVSLLVKGGRPSLSALGWAAVAAGLALGIVAGDRVADRVPPRYARTTVIVLAMAGAVLTVTKGLMRL